MRPLTPADRPTERTTDRPSARALPQLQRPDGSPWRVLLVDDNPINREVGAALLGALGLQVHTALDGDDALRMAAAGHYDLVLMDVQMPRMDGHAATRRLRALPGLAAVPVIAVTANSSAQSRDACLATGMNEFVTKPIDILRLADAVRRCLPAGGSTGPQTG